MADATSTTALDTYDPTTGEVFINENAIADTIARLAEGRINADVFSTITGTDMASRLSVSKALTSSKPVSENLGKTINLVEVVAQSTTYAVLDNKGNKTDERRPGVRLILVDQDGTGYHSASETLFRDITKNILAVLPPTSEWGGPVPIKVEEKGSKPNQFYTLSFV